MTSQGFRDNPKVQELMVIVSDIGVHSKVCEPCAINAKYRRFPSVDVSTLPPLCEIGDELAKKLGEMIGLNT